MKIFNKMLAKFKLLSLSFLCLAATGCSDEKELAEEALVLHLTEGDFPKLITVPDRPQHPTPAALQHIQERLKESNKQSTKGVEIPHKDTNKQSSP